jgi:hypothetical protein
MEHIHKIYTPSNQLFYPIRKGSASGIRLFFPPNAFTFARLFGYTYLNWEFV